LKGQRISKSVQPERNIFYQQIALMGFRAKQRRIINENVFYCDQIGAILLSETVELQFLFRVDVRRIDSENEISSTGANFHPNLRNPSFIQHYPFVGPPLFDQRAILFRI
jgi:hypothetical protein